MGAGLVGAALLVIPTGLLLPTVWTYLASRGRRFDTAQCPARPVAVVLGALVTTQKIPAPLLRQRLDVAAELYHAGTVCSLIVSGDNRAVANRETDAMATYLQHVRQVPTSAVVADPRGYRTWDTCRHVASGTVGPAHRSAVFVTQAFHLPRTIALARAAGIDAVGVGAASAAVRRRPTYYGYVREVGATARALLDVLVRRAG